MNFDLQAWVQACQVPQVERSLELFHALREVLYEANQVTNLTRIIEPEDFAIKHIADSLAIVRYFPDLATAQLKLADIGCGAGFPSLVLAMAFPNLQITAIDSVGKKTAFVSSCQEKFELKNLTVIRGRSVELNRKAEFHQKFDLITARAVAPSPELYAGTSRMVKRGGRYIFYKTPHQAAEEFAELQKSSLKWHRTPIFALPNDAGERLFVYAENFPARH